MSTREPWFRLTIDDSDDLVRITVVIALTAASTDGLEWSLRYVETNNWDEPERLSDAGERFDSARLSRCVVPRCAQIIEGELLGRNLRTGQVDVLWKVADGWHWDLETSERALRDAVKRRYPQAYPMPGEGSWLA